MLGTGGIGPRIIFAGDEAYDMVKYPDDKRVGHNVGAFSACAVRYITMCHRAQVGIPMIDDAVGGKV